METSPGDVATGPLMETGGVTGETVVGGKTVKRAAFPTCDPGIELFADGVVDNDRAGSEAEDSTGSVLVGCLAVVLGVLVDALGLEVDAKDSTVLALLENLASEDDREDLGVEVAVFRDDLLGSTTIEDVL